MRRPALLLGVALASASTSASVEPTYSRYRPARRVPPSLESIWRHTEAGHDPFPEEKTAEELSARLSELSGAIRNGRPRAALHRLLAPEFRGGGLGPMEKVTLGPSPHLQIVRARALASALTHDGRSFEAELDRLLDGLDAVLVAEFLITGIDVARDANPVAVTEVRYDIVGSGKDAWRGARSGRWRLSWRRGADGAWRVLEWTALEDVRSRAPATVFAEVSETSLGGNTSFHQQLVPALDHWSARLDGVFKAGGMGHHGVSAGDADGDGLDDLHVSQPAGLPNRLFRNRGDGTFEDVTAAAGVAVLDSTSQSLFADVDNDGDQDLVLVTTGGLLLFVNDGKGRFSRVPDAFRSRALRGSPTAVTMADYDRDGFLDLYLCTYSYVIGASEEKAGTPTPYHDAQNGPPNVLFRNDGRGHFVDVTAEVGLDENNDRFSFAAAWADYDQDGWPDLLVANDFGRKNLYRNEGLKDGRVTFKDMAAAAGVEDHGAGMSAAWLDYDGDGHLDIYTGNMWSPAGQRVTALPGFMPKAPADVRALYRRHARGNSLFRNRGDGTFEDVTAAARAAMGRWAWSSDVVDFDNDGWEDLYVVNGMFTRDPGESDRDLDSFFWRQVTARSPLSFRPGTPYDDAWRATNRILMAEGSQARHERNVFLRNDGRGGFDDLSGASGLDLDQDGRSFAVLDHDLDGDPDLAVMAARSSPQLRIFRNDFAGRGASIALRLVGTRSNRDAVGARVIVETDAQKVTRIVQAGSGFISQHSRELVVGLGRSQRIHKVTIRWPGGLTQVFSDVPIGHRVRIEEGQEAVRGEPFRQGTPASPTVAARAPGHAEPTAAGTWLYRPFPAPDFIARDADGQEQSLAGLRGRPALLLFWSAGAPPSRVARDELIRQRPALTAAGATLVVLDVGAAADVAGTYSILHRFLFDRRQDMPLPTLLLLDAQGQIVKVYRDRIAARDVLADLSKIEATTAERLARAVPFEGTFHSLPGERNYFQYSLDLAEQGFETAALAGFERAASLDPGEITFYNLGTLHMKAGHPTDAKAAFERALTLKPDYAEASNSLGALLAQSGDVPAAIARFQAALQAKPEFPDALNNLGYALYQLERDDEARALYERALALQPDFPEALNNLGIFFGQEGDLTRAEGYFRQAVDKRPGYGEAANNLAQVLAARGDAAGAMTLLEKLLEANPAFEVAYLTLGRLHLQAGRVREALAVLERLLQRNPTHPQALEMLQLIRSGSR